MRTALILPIRNAESHLDRLIPALASQSLQPDEWLVVDSQSDDQGALRLKEAGARVVGIPRASFNHGGTRRWASTQVEADLLIYLTQDAIPANPDSFRNLCDGLLGDAKHGMAYGRQLPHPGTGLLGAHARRFNYPSESRTKRLEDSARLGIKTCFCSDAFSAYRREALEEVGGFPEDVIGTEDVHVAGRMLVAGWSVRYEATAEVFHAHDYRMAEEFRRYFDIGVFYGRERWIGDTFGKAGGEGLRYVLSELRDLSRRGRLELIPGCVLRSALKWTGYRLGHAERYLPRTLKRRLSMFGNYWADRATEGRVDCKLATGE